jgi:thiamine-monophosphate kinase
MSQKSEKRTDIGSIGEFGLIERITSVHQCIQPKTIKGVGDDAAVIDCGEEALVVTTDLLVEGIHFDLMYHPLKHLGYKAVIVNLSDVCAMNAIPRQITVSLAISNRFSVEAIEELYEGIYAACKQYNVDLIGGDTTSSMSGLVISITAIGANKKEKLTYRNTAKAGDILCVSGDLGAAYLGLQILEREKQVFMSEPDVQPDLEDQSYLIGRQLKPEARLDMVKIFETQSLVPTSMIDISDGLASDILHICKESNCGVLIEEQKVPLRDETDMMALKFQMDPITCALSGGEDYELLFTAAIGDLPKLRLMPSVYIIGEMKSKDFGYKLLSTGGNYHKLTAQGWQHFKG